MKDKSKIELNKSHKEVLFNSAFGAVIRLNAQLDRCSEAAYRLDPYIWYHSLRGVQREIWAKVSDEVKTYSDTKLKEIVPFLFAFQKRSITLEHSNKRLALSTEFYDKLDEHEKYLRVEADKVGLLIPDKKKVLDMIGELD